MSTKNIDKLKNIKMSDKYSEMFENLIKVSGENPEELEMIISYVNSILSGDDAEYFKESFMRGIIRDLISKYHDNTIIDMNHDIKELQSQLDELTKTIEEKNKDINSLNQDIDKLNEVKESLIASSSQLNEVMATKLSTLSTKPKYSVSWKITEKFVDPFYYTCYKNIQEYVDRLKYEYMDKMNVTYDEACKEFYLHAPYLTDIINIMKTFNGNKSSYMLLYQIILYGNWNDVTKTNVDNVSKLLEITPLPTYTLIEEKENISENVKQVLKKLY